jgi:hypothetical protein
MASVKILYNNCYGDFQFSTAFEEEYKKRTGHAISDHGRFYRIGSDSIRCDPLVLAIFEEKGSEWCSGFGSSLDIYEIPAIFERYWEIDEYDGNETVRICISEAYADILHLFMENSSDDINTLRNQYILLTEAYMKAKAIKSPE